MYVTRRENSDVRPSLQPMNASPCVHHRFTIYSPNDGSAQIRQTSSVNL
jgi:hypothetical protein